MPPTSLGNPVLGADAKAFAGNLASNNSAQRHTGYHRMDKDTASEAPGAAKKDDISTASTEKKPEEVVDEFPDPDEDDLDDLDGEPHLHFNAKRGLTRR